MSPRIPRRLLLRGAGLLALAGAAIGTTTPVLSARAESLVVAGRARVGGWDDVGVITWGEELQAEYGHLVLPDPRAWGRERLPVIVFFHGGGWQQSSSWDYVLGAARDLARYGVAVWLPAYRGTPSPGGWPETFLDVLAGVQAVGRLADHAPFTPDLDRLHLAGHSAGGHLALWAAGALASPSSSPDDGHAGRIASAAASAEILAASATSLAGVPDPVRAVLEDDDEFVVDLLGGEPGEHPARYALASPLEQLPVPFPVHVVHGIDDETVPVETVEPYIARLRATGGAGRVELIPGAGHNDLIEVGHPSWDVAREVCLEAVGEPR